MVKRHRSKGSQGPNLLRETYPYTDFPKLLLDGQRVACDIPDQIWTTDTTFRDGQQSRPPYRPEQVLRIFDLLHEIDGGSGLIRQSEFFLYSRRDRAAVQCCLECGYRFPEIIGWIRATPSDLKYVTRMGLSETGILMSVSDYHIFLKLHKTHAQIMESYLDMVRRALDLGVVPRCHLEDITRADFPGFVLPFIRELLSIGDQAGMPIKIRLCDTLGLGVPYPEVTLPRSIPKIIHCLRQEGASSAQLEWHGHNDFHKGQVNAAVAWLYGCSSVNCSIFGVGERTGNAPLEALLVEHAQIKGMHPGICYAALSELAEFVKHELDFEIPANYPLVGQDVNVTCAGIHVDGLLKHQEIYNGFDAAKLLNRPAQVTITDRTGKAGIKHWMATHLKAKVRQGDPRLDRIKQFIEGVYATGRNSPISDAEIRAWVDAAFATDLPSTHR